MADRVTPYKAGGDISDRIDEIVITSPAFVHLEMMDRDRCWLGIGDAHFWIRAENGKLKVGYTEGPIPPVSVEAAPRAMLDVGRK
jgi:hypothetical protein